MENIMLGWESLYVILVCDYECMSCKKRDWYY